MVAATKDITERQRAFCREYIKDFKGGPAYIRAGYKIKSPNAADACASRLLKNAKVQAELSRLREPAEQEAIATHAEVCSILSQIIRARPTDFLEVKPGEGARFTVDPNDLRSHALAGLETRHDERGDALTKIRLHCPIRAAERLAKMRGYDTPIEADVALQHVFADAPEGEE